MADFDPPSFDIVVTSCPANKLKPSPGCVNSVNNLDVIYKSLIIRGSSSWEFGYSQLTIHAYGSSVTKMSSAAMKSYLAKPGEVGGEWHLVDAKDQILGRLAARLATILMGKHRPTYTPHVLTGDCIILINAEKIKLTGRKMDQKKYERYSYYPSGRKIEPISVVMAKDPERVIKSAVRRMLPKNKLGRDMLNRLKVYAGPQHPHGAQQPKAMAN